MKYLFTILLALCLAFAGSSVLAQQHLIHSELDSLADEALQLTKFNRLEEAKLLLERFGELFAEKGIAEKKFTIDELRVLSTAQNEALGAVTSIGMKQSDRVNRVTSFRLAVDALASRYQPMWTELEDKMLHSFGEVKGAALEGDTEEYNRQLNEFLSLYSMIQPSIKLDIPVEFVQRMDSRMTFLDRYRSKLSDDDWGKQLDEIELELKSLSAGMNKDEIDPSVWWVMIMTGSIIVTTLSYVSWKKYRGEKQKRKGRNADD